MLADCYTSGLPRPCYFYCSRSSGDVARSDATQVLGSLARQLSCLQDHGTLSDASVELYKQGKELSVQGPSLKRAIQLIGQLLAIRPRSCIILDAIDECSPEDKRILLDALREILQQTSTDTKLFISTRDDQDIKVDINVEPTVEVTAAQTTHDVNLFIENGVSKAARKTILHGDADQDLILLIKDRLQKGAGGMYIFCS